MTLSHSITFQIILFIIFVIWTSVYEAVMHNQTKLMIPRHSKVYNEHEFYTFLRMLVFVAVFDISFSIKYLITLLATIAMFPLIHDGIYYTVRNYLNPLVYKKRFWTNKILNTSVDDLTPSTFNFSISDRIICFIVGILLIVIYNISQAVTIVG